MRFRLAIVFFLLVILIGCAPTRPPITPEYSYLVGRSAYQIGDYKTAYCFTKKAAEEGDPNAQYALGYMYYYGEGVQQDIEEAIAWIHKAAHCGQPQAIRAEGLFTNGLHPKAGGTHLKPAHTMFFDENKLDTVVYSHEPHLNYQPPPGYYISRDAVPHHYFPEKYVPPKKFECMPQGEKDARPAVTKTDSTLTNRTIGDVNGRSRPYGYRAAPDCFTQRMIQNYLTAHPKSGS